MTGPHQLGDLSILFLVIDFFRHNLYTEKFPCVNEWFCGFWPKCIQWTTITKTKNSTITPPNFARAHILVLHPSWTPASAKYWSAFFPSSCAFSTSSYKWNHTVWFLSLACFIQRNVFEIHPCFHRLLVIRSFSLLGRNPLYGYNAGCVSVLTCWIMGLCPVWGIDRQNCYQHLYVDFFSVAVSVISAH